MDDPALNYQRLVEYATEHPKVEGFYLSTPNFMGLWLALEDTLWIRGAREDKKGPYIMAGNCKFRPGAEKFYKNSEK